MAGAVLAVIAAILAWTLADGNAVRTYGTLAVLLTVPGYLLIQAFLVPARPLRSRAVHLLLGVGLAPVVVGLSALSTAFSPMGFRATPIIATVTVVCLGLATVAFVRRSVGDARNGSAPVAPSSEPSPAARA